MTEGHRSPSPLWGYAISAAATMLWVGCVLPAGRLADPLLLEDLRTPIHRTPVLLVPALLLLIVAPVAITIARTAVGLRAILAATDAFVCAYAALALTVLEPCWGVMFQLLELTLAFLAVLSAIDVVRWTRSRLPGHRTPRAYGLRLAVASLVLLLPSWLLVQRGCELASILAPFGFVAISAAGVRIARTQTGLRLTAASLHLAIAAHMVVTLRYTIYSAEPRFTNVGPGGTAILVAAAVVLLFAALHVVAHVRYLRQPEKPAEREDEERGPEADAVVGEGA